MSVEMNVVYEGELHCSATHIESGSAIQTDAPKDNQGKGETFSPTDLVGTALGTCIMTIMGIMAKRAELDLKGTKIHVVKDMADAPLRRIGKLALTVTFPKGLQLDDTMKKKLERAVDMCPVKQSLHPDIEIKTEFIYQ